MSQIDETMPHVSIEKLPPYDPAIGPSLNL